MLDLSEEAGQLVRGLLLLTIGVWVLSLPIREYGVKEFLKTLVDFEGGLWSAFYSESCHSCSVFMKYLGRSRLCGDKSRFLYRIRIL